MSRIPQWRIEREELFTQVRIKNIKDKLLAYLEENRVATFIQFKNLLGIDSLGNDNILFDSNTPNIVIWPNVSLEFKAAFDECRDSMSIISCPRKTYLVDGSFKYIPDMQIARMDRGHNWIRHTTPKWAPVILAYNRVSCIDDILFRRKSESIAKLNIEEKVG